MVALTLKDAFGYQATYLTIFGVAFSGSGVCDLRLCHRQSERAVSARLVDRDALNPSGIMVALVFAGSSTMTFIVVYATARGIANPGLFFTASALAVAVGKLCVGRISQSLGSVAVLLPVMVLASVSMLTLASSPGLPADAQEPIATFPQSKNEELGLHITQPEA